MSTSLESLLVVSIEQAVAAPMCTLRLADSGARVIKIERDVGETARHYDNSVNGTSAYFAWLNRGKESITLDLKSREDKDLLDKMLLKADIFVQNLAPGATQRLGFGSKDLVARYPRLIALDIVGYAQDTAYKDMRAYDMLIQAESGLCAVTGTEETPSKVGVSLCDIATGITAHAAILDALISRFNTGKGRAIEVAMFDAVAEWMAPLLIHFEKEGKVAKRLGLSHAQIYPYKRYSCLDGDVVISVQNPQEWRRFCVGVLKQESLVDDQRFHDNPSRVANRGEMDQIIDSVFGTLRHKELLERLNENKIAYGNYNTIEQLSVHPALKRVKVEVAGEETEIAASPLAKDLSCRKVPALGEHSACVRNEFSSLSGNKL